MGQMNRDVSKSNSEQDLEWIKDTLGYKLSQVEFSVMVFQFKVCLMDYLCNMYRNLLNNFHIIIQSV